MTYRQKLDVLSFEQVEKARPLDINGPERILGISYKSLKSLYPEDWRDWILDRLTGGLDQIPYLWRDEERYHVFYLLQERPIEVDLKRDSSARYLAENQPHYLSNMYMGIILAGKRLLELRVPKAERKRYDEAKEQLDSIIRYGHTLTELGVQPDKKSKRGRVKTGRSDTRNSFSSFCRLSVSERLKRDISGLEAILGK